MSSITAALPLIGYVSVPHWHAKEHVERKVAELKEDLQKRCDSSGERFVVEVEEGIMASLIIWRIFE